MMTEFQYFLCLPQVLKLCQYLHLSTLSLLQNLIPRHNFRLLTSEKEGNGFSKYLFVQLSEVCQHAQKQGVCSLVVDPVYRQGKNSITQDATKKIRKEIAIKYV